MNEDGFLASLFQRMPPAGPGLVIGPGDDCAAIDSGADTLMLLAMDQLIGDRHYYMHGDHPPTLPELVGRKLLARNLSDIAAMGGTPLYCLCSLAVALQDGPGEAWLNHLFDGLLELAAACNVELIGGDLGTAPRDNVSCLTIVGTVPVNEVCRRSGAQPGDRLLATGCFGDSLDSGHHLHFIPRTEEGRWLAKHGYVKAMIDVSDGLLIDAQRLCRASQVGLQLKTTEIPLRTSQRPVAQAITDGEDYELLFSVAPEKVEALKSAWPFATTTLTEIGRFLASEDAAITDDRGLLLSGQEKAGFDHWQP